MEWADARMWRAVARHTGPADEKLGTLNTWTAQPMAFREITDFQSLDAVREWARPYYAAAFQFLDAVDEARLEEAIEMPWVAGAGFEKPAMNETMFQVTSHSTYHRGQVNMRLRQLGLESVNVDYIMWLWKGRPQPKW
jgi:uncharacterized damage-inducible protein DinB